MALNSLTGTVAIALGVAFVYIIVWAGGRG